MYRRALRAIVVVAFIVSMTVCSSQNVVADKEPLDEVASIEVMEDLESLTGAGDEAQNDISLELYENPWDGYDLTMSEEEIEEEIMYGEMEMLSQLCQAEAGNQGLTGMRYVADVVLNRVDSDKFPNTIEEVIYQIDPVQFSPTVNGAYEAAAYNMSDEAYEAVELEWFGERLDDKILYFSSTEQPVNGQNAWKFGDHWFSY